MFYKPLSEHISEMHDASSALMEYSRPKGSMEDEKAIICLKERELFIDGYRVGIVLSKNDYDNHYAHTLQIYASYGSFLPFSLVCKIAKMFLGDSNLYYISVIQNDRKIYIWTVCYDRQYKVIGDSAYKKIKEDTYDGLKFYRVLSMHNSNFF